MRFNKANNPFVFLFFLYLDFYNDNQYLQIRLPDLCWSMAKPVGKEEEGRRGRR